MIKLIRNDERDQDLTALGCTLLVAEWMPLGDFRLQIFAISFGIDLLVGGLIKMHHAATEVISAIRADQFLVDIVDVEDEWGKLLASSIVDLELEKLVVHRVAIIVYGLSLDDLTLHTVRVAIGVYCIVHDDFGIGRAVVICSWQALALEEIAADESGLRSASQLLVPVLLTAQSWIILLLRVSQELLTIVFDNCQAEAHNTSKLW